MKKRNTLNYSLFIGLFLTLLASSCSTDEQIAKTPTPEELLTEARTFLSGTIVLNAKATMNGVNKTLLETGCPTKYNFDWVASETNSCTISLQNFTVGKMPLTINFKCDVQFIQLNSWEKKEYKENGWLKFEGKDGDIIIGKIENGKFTKKEGSSIKGYYNVSSHQINFIVDFNMMNVRSECFLQKIEKTRLSNYDAEMKQYEKELETYKKEHGLS